MDRRLFLLTAVSVLAVSSKSRAMQGMNMNGMSMDGGERLNELPTGQPLPDLPKLENNSKEAGVFEATLEAAATTHEFVKGVPTEVLAYNGVVPGPMIEVNEGDKVKITFRNRIGEQDSTVHWHGLAIAPEQDGLPNNPVAPGAEQVYAFEIPDNSAGSYWYHPHPHGHTAEQVYRGLAGAFIVHPKKNPLPDALGNTALVISSISLNMDGSIAENFMMDLMNGREGDHVLVNGAKQPVLTLAPGSSHRFRLYNATNGRYLKLSFEGHPMTLIGSDGGLLAAPVSGFQELLLAPAERAEVVVNFKDTEGSIKLVSNPYERGWMGQPPNDNGTIAIMTINLSGAKVSATPLPQHLREIDDLGAPVATKRLALTETMGMSGGMMGMGFLINGKAYDMNRIDLTSKLGDVELWEIVNTSGMDHPLHFHGGQFQIVEREVSGVKTPAPFHAWKDTVNITNGETVRLKMKQGHVGLRMFHCHILEHEDAGMMGTLNVVG